MARHVAILRREYLDAILRGEKTVECRVSQQRRAPFGRVRSGDVIHLKQSGGPYRGLAIAGQVLSFGRAGPEVITEIEREYDPLIGAGQEYWTAKRDASYVTLVWLEQVSPSETGPDLRAVVSPGDRRGWHCLGD
ncbi:MAG: ASCH domain-containing protein [Planctomycetota bacterium]